MTVDRDDARFQFQRGDGLYDDKVIQQILRHANVITTINIYVKTALKQRMR